MNGRGSHIAFRILGYSVGTLMILIGLMFLLAPGNLAVIPEQYRTLFGITVILYGTYRIISTYMRYRNETRNKT